MPCKLCKKIGHNQKTCPTTLVYSTIDNEICTGLRECCDTNAYGECRCQPCPICFERAPSFILHCKNPIFNGVWIGPHCISCDYQIWLRYQKKYKIYQ